MDRITRKLSTIVVLLGLLSGAPVAFADTSLHFWENRGVPAGQTHLDFGLRSLSTDANFDYQGTLVAPAGLTSYQRIQGDFGLGISLSPRLTAFGTVAWTYISVDGTIRPGSVFGLSDQQAGLHYVLLQAESEAPTLRQLSLQARVDIPAYKNATSTANGTPDLGDQSLDLTFGGFLEARLAKTAGGQVSLLGGLAYQQRTQGFSASLPWSLEARYVPARSGFLGRLGFLGQQSLNTDERKDNNVLVTTSAAGVGSGGSFMTGGINAGVVQVRGSVGFQSADAWLILGSLTKTMYGHFVPSSATWGLFIQKQFGASSGTPERAPRPGSLQPQEYGKGNRGFVSYGPEAHVTRVSDRMGLIRIDRGSQDGVEAGQIYDVFSVRPDGKSGEAIARCRVTSVKPNESALSIEEYFKEVWIDEGFIARRTLQ